MSAMYLAEAMVQTNFTIPFFLYKVPAGFPSPAQDYIEQTLDLNELCIQHPAATFFVRVSGDSMIEAGIFHNDVLVVDRSVQAEHGDVVVASMQGEFTVKELCTKPSLMLLPRNRLYRPIRIVDGADLAIFGVVTNVVRQMKRR